MTADVFLDSNILLYASSSAPADAGKRKRAVELIMETRFALSGQVLQEFIANALRKKSLGIPEKRNRRDAGAFRPRAGSADHP